MRAAVMIGVPVAVGYALLMWLWATPLGGAIFAGAFGGLFAGLWLARRMWRVWPEAADLDPDDRVAVVRAVRRGSDLGDRRLAGAVVRYAAVVQRELGRERSRQTWVVVALAAVGAVAWTVVGPPTLAIAGWLLTGALIVSIVRRPARIRAELANAARAAELASP